MDAIDPDLALLERWRGGDHRAGQDLSAVTSPTSIASSSTRSGAEADELAQTTFLVGLAAREQFRGQSSFPTSSLRSCATISSAVCGATTRSTSSDVNRRHRDDAHQPPGPLPADRAAPIGAARSARRRLVRHISSTLRSARRLIQLSIKRGHDQRRRCLAHVYDLKIENLHYQPFLAGPPDAAKSTKCGSQCRL